MNRDQYGQFAKRRSPLFIAASWLATLLSIALLLLLGNFVKNDMASFRSCSANNAGLVLTSCGKQSMNVGDFVLIGLMILAAAMTVSLFTAAWRMSRGRK